MKNWKITIALGTFFNLAAFAASAEDENIHTGSSFKDCEVCPELVVIPSGSFVMGSPSDEYKRTSAEGPQHRVGIQYELAVGKFEVTQAEWRHVMGHDMGPFVGPRHPVDRVSWDDAQAYLRKLSAMTGWRYRLLSEAEWEYAARARTATPFHTGDRITDNQANFDDRRWVSGKRVGSFREMAIPVGSFDSNSFGLHDMHGNVGEWVGDCWNDDYDDAPGNGASWNRGTCVRRVIRGGAWWSGPIDLRAASRFAFRTDARGEGTGFRVARTLDPDSGQATATTPTDKNKSKPEADLDLTPGRTFHDCPGCPEMVVIPPGSFIMGSPPHDRDQLKFEAPQHSVTIGYSFAVGKFEVTQAEWRAVMDKNSNELKGDRSPVDRGSWNGALTFLTDLWRAVMGKNPCELKGDRCPVVGVSWNDAQTFLTVLSETTRQHYRLLSEAEWEYAARAGTTTRYFWGDLFDESRVPMKGEEPVGRYGANAFGIHDMHGNVAEWVGDCWHENYDGAPSDGSTWTRDDCVERVLRDGFFKSSLRSASRDRMPNYDTRLGLGFRVARTFGPAGRTTDSDLLATMAEASKAKSPIDLAIAPGSTFRDCRNCPEMVAIPSGSFMMGSPPDEEGRREDESPQHRVTIVYDLAVGTFEVTQAEWRAMMGDNPSLFKGDRDPVALVSWDDVQKFLRKLSQTTGQDYRLLSEAEWEYAARAGTATRYFWGDDFSESLVAKGDRPEPVGRYGANPFGIHDMHGNLWEWVGDCWNENYHGAPNDGSTWAQGDCAQRVLRGGSWIGSPYSLRSANRSAYVPSKRYDGYGFRVARTLTK